MHLERSVVVRQPLAIRGRQKHRRVEKLLVDAKSLRLRRRCPGGLLLRGLLRGVRPRHVGRRACHSDGGPHRPMRAVPLRPLLDLRWCVPTGVHGVQPPTATVVVLSLRVGDIPSSLDERNPSISTSILPEEQLVIQPHILECVQAVDLIGRVPNGQAHAEGLAAVGQRQVLGFVGNVRPRRSPLRLPRQQRRLRPVVLAGRLEAVAVADPHAHRLGGLELANCVQVGHDRPTKRSKVQPRLHFGGVLPAGRDELHADEAALGQGGHQHAVGSEPEAGVEGQGLAHGHLQLPLQPRIRGHRGQVQALDLHAHGHAAEIVRRLRRR
mmetsp:Transcript_28461/g.81725  ORF Transcript_28461/g.81725 Transcript_28461/m.81725 type:complete len:325 (-) Transcript_28461:547-1521(-)